MGKKFGKGQAKEVWKKVFGVPCSKCGTLLSDPKREFYRPRSSSFKDISKVGIPIEIPDRNYCHYWVARKDVTLCEECFQDFDVDAGNYDEFKKNWSKLFKEIR